MTAAMTSTRCACAAQEVDANETEPPRRPRPASQLDPARAIERAMYAGVSAVWTHDFAATVELARLRGPRDDLLTRARPGCLVARVPRPWRLASVGVRTALYQCCLTAGTQFDIYRWINLVDLADVWESLRLAPGVRSEWARVLSAAGLITHRACPAERRDPPIALRAPRIVADASRPSRIPGRAA